MFRARVGDCLTDPGIVCSAVACRPEREPLFRGATAELCEAKQEIFAFQRNNGASNVRKRCGVFRARVGDCLTDPGIVCSAVACRPERDPLFRGATAELYEAKQEIFAFQRNNGASNVRKRCGAFRARVGDCLTDPGIVCSAVACRPEREPLFRGATAELYEAGEGVSGPLPETPRNAHSPPDIVNISTRFIITNHLILTFTTPPDPHNATTHKLGEPDGLRGDTFPTLTT